MPLNKLERQRRRMARWVVLEALYESRSRKVGSGLIALSMQDHEDLDLDLGGVHECLAYLKSKALIEVTESDDNRHGLAQITHHGIDYVEGNLPHQDIQGIYHPDEA